MTSAPFGSHQIFEEYSSTNEIHDRKLLLMAESKNRFVDPKIASFRLGETEFDVWWMLAALDSNDEIWKKNYKNLTIKEINSSLVTVNRGFISEIFKVQFQFLETAETYCVAVKVPTGESVELLVERLGKGDESAQKQKFEWLIRLHNRECDFLTLRHNIESFVRMIHYQKFDLSKRQNGAIIMEYLDNAVPTPLHESFNFNQIMRIVQLLAQFHAYSLSLSTAEMSKFALRCDTTQIVLGVLNDGCKSAIAQFPELRESFKHFEHLTISKEFYNFSKEGINDKLEMKPVLVHADLWSNNILWRMNNDGSSSDELRGVIDFQMMRRGAIGEDIANFLSICCDTEIRHHAESVIFDLYYDQLQKDAVKRKVSVSFTKDQVIRSYHNCSIATVLQVLILASVVSQYMIKEVTPEEATRRKETLTKRLLMLMRDVHEFMKIHAKEWLNPCSSP
ncbi:hypothetical protein AB6A40_006660 [Gnathostoma spinigerum]|uniref:CHK kinase-like domain-containing protein n=1 Tax=Gnathostoma spinigerum TaxID=75299 RepID=A0ABD6EL16_9BILA